MIHQNNLNMSSNSNKDDLTLSLYETLKWLPTENQIEQFIRLQVLLEEWNKTTNLTRLINGNDYWISQVCDSLWPLTQELRSPNLSYKYIDVGSGCGFPGLAVAIAIPNSNITLLDSSNKKTAFLKEVSKEIRLNQRIHVITERAEITGHKQSFRKGFDYALARAVAPAAVVAEYLIPFLNSTGQGLLFKGKWTNEEQNDLGKALLKLNAKVTEVQKFNLPDNRGPRNVIRIASIAKCPNKYPRTVGTPRKQPLCN